MSSRSEAAKRLKNWLNRQVRREREWRNDVETAAHDCLRAREASQKQKAIAREILKELEVIVNDTGHREYRAFQIGLLYEDMRLAVLSEPAEVGRALGARWRGYWIKATAHEQRILQITHYDESIELHQLVRSVWDKSYDPRHRGYLDQALAALNRKLAEAGAPTIHVRGEFIVIDVPR